jgi:hypothetical protein
MPTNEQTAKANIFNAFSKIGGNGMKLNFDEMNKGVSGRDLHMPIPDLRKSRLYFDPKRKPFVNTGIRGNFTQSVDMQNRILRLTLKTKSKSVVSVLWTATRKALGWDFKEIKEVYRYIADKNTVYFFTDKSLADFIMENHRKM